MVHSLEDKLALLWVKLSCVCIMFAKRKKNVKILLYGAIQTKTAPLISSAFHHYRCYCPTHIEIQHQINLNLLRAFPSLFGGYQLQVHFSLSYFHRIKKFCCLSCSLALMLNFPKHPNFFNFRGILEEQ